MRNKLVFFGWISRPALSLMREIAFLLGILPPISAEHDEVIKSFIETNSKYWGKINEGGQNILIEGHLAEYGPNYLFRTAVAAKSIQEAVGTANIIVVVNGFSHEWQSARKAYASFGISRWVFLGSRFSLISLPILICATFLAGFKFIRIKSPSGLLYINLGGIRVGDLIYDEVLRSTKQPTIRNIDYKVFKAILRSCYFYYQYQILFKLSTYDYYVATHTAYPQYGLLCRVALQHGTKVIETTDIQMSVYDTISDTILPTYHQGIHDAIYNHIQHGPDLDDWNNSSALSALKRRLDSNIQQIDAQKAYSGMVYGLSDLRSKLNISTNHRIGFILAHVFCDSPHLSTSMLFTDYYTWLVNTISFCADSAGISWIIKPHPSCSLYDEEGMVEDVVFRAGATNVHVCPTDFNTSSLRQCADVIVTVHGTAGLEYSCFGIPTILAGTPFYAGFGFTIEPQTVESYAMEIRRSGTLQRLNRDQLNMALRVFEAWEKQFDWENMIITPEVLAYVWGNGVDRDVSKAYRALTRNIEFNNPRDMKLWKFARSVSIGH